MIKGKRQLLMAWIMALMMIMNVVFPINTAYADSVENTLTHLTVKVSQNGTEIGEGGTLTSTKPVSVEISFGVSVIGDEPTPANTVKKGDTATFELSNAFKLISGGNIELKTGDIVVGHVNLATDTLTKMVVANVIFDGTDEVFDGTDDTINTVKCKFNASLEYDASNVPVDGGDVMVQILQKTFTVNVPPIEKVYTVTKSGTPNLADKTIEWRVDVTGTQGGTSLDLKGNQFSDDLSTVGVYVPDSFKVGGTPATPVSVGNIIRYTFPEGSTSPQAITFKTTIPDEKYNGAGEQKITNKAQLLNSKDSVMAEGQAEVKFAPQWIDKKGESSDSGSTGVYDPTKRTIKWTITANQMGATLDKVVITDVLPDGLTLNSASWQAWDGTLWGTPTTISPNGSGEYEIGNIKSMILLTIVTNVPDDPYTTGAKTYYNSASIRWDGLSGSGIGTGNIGVGVGYNAITKSGTAYEATRTIHWNVTVDTKGQSIPDLKVYDLLVYGSNSSGFDITKVTGIPGGINKGDLTPRYDQKYVTNSLTGSGLNIVVHTVTKDGEPVADLLEITGFSINNPNTFTFDSLVVNPDIFAGNKTSQIWNTASLFSANTKLNAASGYVDYTSKILSKEMLKREAMSDPAAGVNNYITKNMQDGFDYQDKSVIFRLSINADGKNLNSMTNAKGQLLGITTVTDTLPDGWEYAEIAAGSKYLIFEGTGNSDGTVQAKDTTPDVVTGLAAGFSGRTATFTFNPLDKPYVILVKARPTSETVAGYFNANKTTTEQNNLALTTANWTTGVTSFQKVSVNSKLLEKTLIVPKAGELRWTVDYKPYDLLQPGTKLQDTLPAGIDLRTDSSGALLLSDNNITVREMTLNADGSYTAGAEVTLKIGVNVYYDNATRVISFIIPDSAKAYRFSYLTDITGEPGTISNQVSLYSDSTEQEEAAHSYKISALDGEATLQRNGWIVVTKIDGDGSPLADAEFTIFTSDGKTVIRKGVTGSDGTVKLKVIPDGEYILRESKAPAGYNPEGRTHSLSVTTTGSTVVSSIDGKTGKDANAITVQNYLEGTVGNLIISKMVAGNAVDTAKAFDFTVTFSGANGTYNYIGNGVPNGTIKSGDAISLAHGQSIMILGLPKDASYTLSEADYTSAGYSKASTGETGIIAADTTQTASFINTRNVWNPDPEKQTGNLTISKTVAGIGADTTLKFNFTVTFSGASGSYHYTGNGVPEGTIKSGDTISLAHGQSITIADLPAGAGYQVSEEKASAQGYSVESAGSSGTISSTQDRTAAFTNTKLPGSAGSLTISKTVTGQGADFTKKFNFTVTFTDAPDAYPYTGASTGNLRSGGTISLANGESITITDLPEGTQYTVTEADYSRAGYTVSSTGSVGVISANTVKTALFTNNRSSTPGKPGSPEDPTGNIDDGDVPHGSKDIGENDIPKTGDNGMPKTGDNQAGSLAKLGLLFITVAFAGLSTADFILRKKKYSVNKKS